jgi:NhaP-type Na+/H+ or K+/H+ antiporter
LRIPALIVLLPAGFVAGTLTSDVNPEKLLGAAFEPLVSLAVAVILYDAGLSLDLRKLTGHPRRVVIRLISVGALITWVIGAACAAPLLGMSRGAALELGAILVVSGPTVVGPLLRFVRPAARLRRVLAWEGSLIDPVGGTLGAVVFHAVLADTHRHLGAQLAEFVSSLAIGIGAGAAGALVLWLLLSKVRLGEVLGTSAQLAAVIGVAAVCDVIRDDAGLIAAIVMGLAAANLPGFDVPARRPFFEMLVQLVIGLLFISISATVTPASLRHVVLPALALAGVLVFAVRPLVAWLCTRRTDLNTGERAFVGWMAPRGIVAAATASTFSAALAAKGVQGAAKILPATFMVIVATVVLYGLTAVPVARRLRVMQPPRSRPLLVGGDAWVVELGRALHSAGLDVLMWAGLESEREQIRLGGLELAPGELLASAAGGGAELEGITAVFLLTGEDDFNALASTILEGTSEASVYRLAPARGSHGVVAPFTGSDILFSSGLNRAELGRRHEAGARIVTCPPGSGLPAGPELLFVISSDGRLEPVTSTAAPEPAPGSTIVLLDPDGAAGC